LGRNRWISAACVSGEHAGNISPALSIQKESDLILAAIDIIDSMFGTLVKCRYFPAAISSSVMPRIFPMILE